MKKYRIGEIAELLNVSKEMIRYYERCGIIAPDRTESNYREYSALDQFSLMEAVVLSNFHLNIAEIGRVKNLEYSETMQNHLRKFISETVENISHEKLLIERAQEFSLCIDTGQRNIGRTWIKKVDNTYWFPYLNSHNDQYDAILMPDECRKLFLSRRITAFLDALISFEEDRERWYLSLKEKYTDDIDLKSIKGLFRVPEHFALCTIIDMGEIGTFERGKIDELLQNLQKDVERSTFPPVGMLLQRGVDQNRYHRLIEIQIPIKE